MDDILHIVTAFNRWNDERNVNVNRNDNNWNDNGAFAWSLPKFSSFLPRFLGGVLFYDLPIPSAEHFADARKFFRKFGVVLGVEQIHFPDNLEKYFERIDLRYCFLEIR